MLGCAYLYPHMIPDPYTNTVALKQDDEFMIVGSQGLWHYVGYDEAVQEVYETGNPVVAAKKLQDLAQGYGSKENIAILVIRFNTDSRPSLGKLRPHKRSMSIDDIEAAAKHAENRNQHNNHAGQVDYNSHVDYTAHADHHISSVVEPPSERPSIIMEGSYCSIDSSKSSVRTSTNSSTRMSEAPSSAQSSIHMSDAIDVSSRDNSTVLSKELLQSEQKDIDTMEGRMSSGSLAQSSSQNSAQVSQMFNFSESDVSLARSEEVDGQGADDRTLKPLPNQRYLKKDAASEWEGILQKRLTEQVKSKELQQILDSSHESLLPDVSSRRMSIVEIDAACTGLSLPPEDKLNESLDSTDAGKPKEPIFTMHSMKDKMEASSLVNLRRKEPKKVKNTIAMFENLTSPELQPKRNFLVRREGLDNPQRGLADYQPMNTSHIPSQDIRSTAYTRSQSPGRGLGHPSTGGSTYYSSNQQATPPSNQTTPLLVLPPRDSQLSSDDDTLCDSDALSSRNTMIGSDDRSHDTVTTPPKHIKQQLNESARGSEAPHSMEYPRPATQSDAPVIEIARL